MATNHGHTIDEEIEIIKKSQYKLDNYYKEHNNICFLIRFTTANKHRDYQYEEAQMAIGIKRKKN